MIRWVSVLITLAILGAPAVAQTVVVRSGDHGRFTRLVVPLPNRAGWSVEQSGRTLVVTVDVASIRFDVANVFDRIPRNRLIGLSQSTPGSSLILELACDCTVSSFSDSPDFLVLDIRDSRDRDVRRKTTTEQKTGSLLIQNPYRFISRLNPKGDAPRKIPRVMLPVAIGQLKPPRRPVAHTAAATELSKRRRTNSIGSRGVLNISEERLLAQISRASEQGLLDLRVKPKRVEEAMLPTDSDATQMVEPPVIPPAPLPITLSAITVIDRDLSLVARSIDTVEAEPICLASDLVALKDWGGWDQSFAEAIGGLRSRLFGEFDKVDPKTAIDLAKTYLYYGFGAEAIQAVDLSQKTGEEAQVLRALAEILDTGKIVGDDPFIGQYNCDGDVALWAIFSGGTPAYDVNRNAIKLAFSRLPPHLRSALGAQISRKFTTAGDGELADFILRTVMRIGVEPGSGLELAKAEAADLKGDTEGAERELAKSVASESKDSPEALVKLVTSTFATRGAISPELPDLVGSYAREFRSADIGEDLRRAHVVALALAGQFVEAFETLGDLEERDGHSNREKTLSPLLALLSERADDVGFLRFSLKIGLEDPEELPESIKGQVARRLLDLGFAEQAALWVGVANSKNISEVRKLMRAEISLARRMPSRAIAELMGMVGPEAAKLLAEALWQQGNYPRASQMLIEVEEFDTAARGYWLAGEWEAVPEQAGARYAQIVAGSVQLRGNSTENLQMTPLAQARDLMSKSFKARADIAALLQTISLE